MTRTARSALFVAPDIAPASRGGEIARAAYAFARALASQGVDVAVCAPRAPEEEPEDLGLARWLEPLSLPERGRGDEDGRAGEVALYEGALPSGGGRLFLVDAGSEAASRRQAPRAAIELARTRLSQRAIVHATDETAETLPLAARELAEDPPATVLTALAEAPAPRALPAADRAAAPTSDQAKILSEAGFSAIAIPPGIDEATWSPWRDPHTAAPFSAAQPDGKATCKLELQRELGLPPRAREPLIAALPPLEATTLTSEAADALAQTGAQLALLVDPRADDPHARQIARDLAARYPTRVAAADADPGTALAHRALAGADFALFLSGAPPRGMSRLYPLAYGDVPIAPRAGEFADRLVDLDPRTATGTGILYTAGVSSDLVTAVRRAVRAFHDRAVFAALSQRAMTYDLSWRATASRYLELYRDAAAARRAAAA